jgi:hypothetical protein
MTTLTKDASFKEIVKDHPTQIAPVWQCYANESFPRLQKDNNYFAHASLTITLASMMDI